jgi:hypothetical protein
MIPKPEAWAVRRSTVCAWSSSKYPPDPLADHPTADRSLAILLLRSALVCSLKVFMLLVEYSHGRSQVPGLHAPAYAR